MGRGRTLPGDANPLRARTSPATLARELLPEPIKRLVRPVVARGRHLQVRATGLATRRARAAKSTDDTVLTAVGPLAVDPDDALVTPELRRQGYWEPEVHRALERALFPGATFVDVGANVGYFTVLGSRLVGPEGRVFAVEPEAESLRLLRTNIERGGCANVTVIEAAAVAEPGTARLVRSPDGRSGSALRDDADGAPVRTERLDDLLEGARVDVFKVDAEGSEPLALLGAGETIRSTDRVIAIVEFRPTLPRGGFTPEETLAVYESLGFSLALLRANGTARPAAADKVLAMRPPSRFLNLALLKGWTL